MCMHYAPRDYAPSSTVFGRLRKRFCKRLRGPTRPDSFRVILRVRLPGGRVVEKDVSPRSELPSLMDVLVEAEVEITEDDLSEHDPLYD